MAQLMFKISNEPPADMLQYTATVPPGPLAFFRLALAKNSDERFQTGEEFAQALRAAAAAGARGAGIRATQFVGGVDVEL